MNTRIATHIEGITYTFDIPKTREGWYQIRPLDTKKAKVAGPAELDQIEDYLKRLDKIRITLVMKRNGVYHGIPDKANKYGLSMGDLLPVFLCDDTPMDFDRIIARYDGANFWFERVDQGNDPSKAEYLRNSMLKVLGKIEFQGLTAEEKVAYTLRLTLDKKLVADQKKETLKKDVEFAGGTFVKFMERADHYSVTYKVDGNEYTSHIAKDPRRSVMSAGLCLAGDDRKFDLKSLITVIREGQNRHLIHHYHLR